MSDQALPSKHRLRLSFTAQALVVQLLVVIVSVAGAVTLAAWLNSRQLTGEIQQRALAVARTTAENRDIQAEVSRLDALPKLPPNSQLRSGAVQTLAEQIRHSTGALYVVITDREGLRLSHPEPQLLGLAATGRSDEVLAGHEETDIDKGALGVSARARVPMYSVSGGSDVIGEVSVGFSIAAVDQAILTEIAPLSAATLGALIVSAVASTLVAKRLRKLTRELEPEQIATLLQDQEAVLHGVAEGVLGIAPDGRVTVCTSKAQHMLKLDEVVGRQFMEAGLPTALTRFITEPMEADLDIQLVIEGSVLRVLARPVARGTSNLGWVLTIFDRTQVIALTEQLDAVAALSNALRVQRHEFANRLHAVTGLLDVGDIDEARHFLHAILQTGPVRYPLANGELLNDLYLKAFLGAKAFEASERGVQLRIGEETAIHGDVRDPNEITTVIGNLIDNAIEAAVTGSAGQRWVEIELLDDGDMLHLVVSDSGDGITVGSPSELPFQDGFTTAVNPMGGHGRGIGLPLSRRVAQALGGNVWLASPGAPGGPGAVFCARLPGVISAKLQQSRADSGLFHRDYEELR